MQDIATKQQTDAQQQALKARGPLPKHIAIIMDGNGRWAKSNRRPRVFGHQEGVSSVREIAEASAEVGIDYLTLYTFSTENWYRPSAEVNALMQLLIRTLRREKRTFLENGIRLHAIGAIDRLPPVCIDELYATMEETADLDRMTLTLALSYSGRWEIVEAARKLMQQAQAGTLQPEDLTEDRFAAELATAGMPDPDLLIRTGGDLRVSNYLLWQIAYTELVVTECFWPSFRRAELYEAIRTFQDRERRFGRVLDPASE